nr:bifunctional ADP-dependent NAD(P)H-hydrate dehydratase/NAD(P)H-hydrate epimerase [Halobacillus sp. KGW1]
MDIVTAHEMYERDRLAMEAGIDGRLLMENAGRAVAYDFLKRIEPQQKVVVLIGGGNNGGDGFVIARTLMNLGCQTEVVQVVPDDKIRGDALEHKRLFEASGYRCTVCPETAAIAALLEESDICMDAILGIGVKGRLKEPIASIIHLCNEADVLRLAVDIPTGVPAGETDEEFDGYRAHYTSIIEAPKLSAFLQQTQPFYGEWSVVEIGLPKPLLPDVRRRWWREQEVQETLPKRDAHAHKGTHGKGLVIGGSALMPGSIAMSARAALRSGAGLVAVGTEKEAVPAIASFVQEATFVDLFRGQVQDNLEGYDGIAVGMGLGREDSKESLVGEIIRHAEAPLLLDADGLYHAKAFLEAVGSRQYPTILTPHPGEFAHLLGLSVKEVLQSPFSLTRAFAEKYGVYLVLKGPSTIITSPDGRQRVDTSGNVGLAKGGSGDVLSGILLAMIMQGADVLDAVCDGCFVHGRTADLLVESDRSNVDLLATDVIEGLSRTFRTFS